MPSDQTPRQPGATPLEGTFRATQRAEFSEALIGESGDPIWEPRPPAQVEAGRVERAERVKRAGREPEGKLPPGKIIDLDRSRQA